MSSSLLYANLPEWDEKNLRPKTKMPLCPNCNEDELGMLSSTVAKCYNCNYLITKNDGHWRGPGPKGEGGRC